MSETSTTKKVFDNRYEILSIIGRGSRSVVYRARLITAPYTEVALKVLLNQKDVLANNERLRKEALAMVSSRHKYVVRLDDFHSVDNICYLAMELAPEADLRKYLLKCGGSLPYEQIETYLLQTLEALAFIHQAGIVHRDLKPDNLLVVDEKNIRIGDFGVAVLPGEIASFEDLQKGVGTMDYMAPEVLEGTSYDRRADVYSIALSFYELLTGRHPFAGVSMARQLEARQDENLVPLATLNSAVPPAVAAAIMQALSYDPARRFLTAKEFLEALHIGGAIDHSSGKIKSVPDEAARKALRRRTYAERRKRRQETEQALLEVDELFAEDADDLLTAEPEPAAEITPVLSSGTVLAEGGAGVEASSGNIISSAQEQAPAYDPIPAAAEVPVAPSPAAEPETLAEDKIKTQVEIAKSNISPLFVIGVLAVVFAGALLLKKIYYSFSTSAPSTEQAADPLLPEFNPQEFSFPYLPSGVYSGTIENFYPGMNAPLTLISYAGTQSLAVIVGVEGWKPVYFSLADLYKAKDSGKPVSALQVRSGGNVLNFTGQNKDGTISGTWNSVITQGAGTWTVTASSTR